MFVKKKKKNATPAQWREHLFLQKASQRLQHFSGLSRIIGALIAGPTRLPQAFHADTENGFHGRSSKCWGTLPELQAFQIIFLISRLSKFEDLPVTQVILHFPEMFIFHLRYQVYFGGFYTQCFNVLAIVFQDHVTNLHTFMIISFCMLL